VWISTDKAVRPSSIYGATKRLAEMIVLNAASESQGSCTVVRFGNVLGSRGSIIPIFKQQIAKGGPVTITHPDMFRFFMTIPEAVYLVLQAASMENSGETFVLNMGEPIRILSLAEDLIRLSGLEPERDIEIAYTGIRPGEKLLEELWDEGTPLLKTLHPDIFRLDADASSTSLHPSAKLRADLPQVIEALSASAAAGDTDAVVGLLDELIPGSSIHESPHQEITFII
jgi:FlaA1/EpsC-like NDP-sugar epimerase